MRYKNVTFECELCFMSPSTELEVIATPKNGVTQRCRTENANPALSVPHSKEVMAVKETHFCLGSRQFHRFEPCNYHSQKKWSQACLLSSKYKNWFLLKQFILSLRRRIRWGSVLFGVLGIRSRKAADSWRVR